MEKKKSKILSELYAIKAGLSVISLEREKLKKEEDNINNSKEKVNQNLDGITQTKRQIADLNNVIESTQVASDKAQTKTVKVTKKAKISSDDRSFLWEMFFKTLGALGGIFLCYMFVYSCTDKNNRKPIAENFVRNNLIVIAAISSALPLIILLGGIISNKSINKKQKLELENDLESEKKNLKERLENAKKSLQENEAKLSYLESQKEEIAIFHSKNLKAYDQNSIIYVESSKVIYDALVKEYNLTLSSSEWSNLDLIIYYFETGRADTIKEALQLMDKQIQHEELIETLKVATNSICGSIENSINSLKEEMVTCFGKLTTQIEHYHKLTLEKLDKIEDKIDDSANMVNQSVKMLSYNISEIISQEKMHSALLTKINIGSGELVNDANYMLSYRKNSTDL